MLVVCFNHHHRINHTAKIQPFFVLPKLFIIFFVKSAIFLFFPVWCICSGFIFLRPVWVSSVAMLPAFYCVCLHPVLLCLFWFVCWGLVVCPYWGLFRLFLGTIGVYIYRYSYRYIKDKRGLFFSRGLFRGLGLGA